ncbi:Fe(3+) ABC transporter substrate-binding protein [Halorhodospira halochloris]|uniref:Ferric iron ABC transporter n=1 Tax=Halorhodospira halochloris TaxID=1052 RepID=A0A0X8X6U2_HALHR|nr:Fe(3+) ABC transporter substrate-binding protein [Halorhodospira halochloris]MBK1650795.1 Fe(3+) ABC transporter substrate-binding protein [Halorhodospira halochloris]MCG5530234.1 Fe(3+) ABC transporter substrate-binding protein [Halorhodospira halochloris]MCG5547148.1 Fe(3+) ABC transporter substrate-binding protein [Halorhodospira halochloris]BAU56707.1 ferric iron ABC transporter [Halorhodospira halochloris]
MSRNTIVSQVGLALIAVGATSFIGCADVADDEITVYSARQEHLIKPIFEKFSEDTGISVRYVTDEAGPLMERLRAEGERTPADVLMTVDAGNLYQAATNDLLKPIESPQLGERIPEHLRDPEDRWFGLSVRARTIVYSPDRVDPDELNTYEGLADEKWQDRLCLRTSQKVYNQSLVAMLLHHLGEEDTTDVVEGWVANLATDPFSNDTSVIEAIEAGQCDVGIVNTYYLGRLLRDDPDYPVEVFWPNQDERGVHVNVSGAGVTRHASNPELAQELIEWLAGDEAQESFAALNLEYPAAEGVDLDPIVAEWGEFKEDTINVSEAGRLQREATMLMDRAGYR